MKINHVLEGDIMYQIFCCINWTARSILVVLPILVVAFLLPTRPVTARPIGINVNIPTVALIEGQDTFGNDELFSRVNIDRGGFQQSGIVSAGDGDTVNPNWAFSGTIDPRGRTTYDVGITFQLFDDDVTTIEQIDINPNPG